MRKKWKKDIHYWHKNFKQLTKKSVYVNEWKTFAIAAVIPDCNKNRIYNPIQNFLPVRWKPIKIIFKS